MQSGMRVMGTGDIVSLISLVFGVVSSLALAAIWVGGQKVKREELERRVIALESLPHPDYSARIAALELHAQTHIEVREVIARLEERLSSLQAALNQQPAVIASVVATVLKETLRSRAA